MYQKHDDTFFVLRFIHAGDAQLSCSLDIEAWVEENIPPAEFLYENETSEMSPFESYTFLREIDAVMFKLRWFGS